MTTEGCFTHAILRSNTYRQIYHLFEYPAEGKGIFLSGEMDLSFPGEAGSNRLKAVQEHMAECLEEVSDTEAVEAEYVRLFDYRPVCAPYENAYRRDTLPHDLVAELASAYREAGATCGETKAPDHIMVEFEFMHYLCYQEAVAVPAEQGVWRDRQRRFLKDHLLQWVPSFSAALVREAAAPYRLLGELVEALMEMESRFISGDRGASVSPEG